MCLKQRRDHASVGRLVGELEVVASRPSGAPDTNRTCDLSLRRRLLYPLSYGGGAGSLYNGITCGNVARAAYRQKLA